MTLDGSDADWYLEHVLAAAEPGAYRRVRPAQAEWRTRAEHALDAADSPEQAAAVRAAVRQGFVITRAQARSAGVDEPTLRRLVRAGRWHCPWRGVVSPLPVDDATRTTLPATAAALRRPRSTVSHGAAGQIFGLPLLDTPASPILTVDERSAFTGHRGVRLHVARLAPGDLDTWFGCPITSAARTVVDIARAEGRRAGLVVADAALREGLLTNGDLRAAVRRSARRPGAKGAAAVAALANPLAESALESLTRLCCHDAGLPPPQLQAWIETAAGSFRVDLLFRVQRVIVEADGAVKYRGHPDALWREKRRQEALERAGYRVVRVTWADVVHHPDATVRRIRAAL